MSKICLDCRKPKSKFGVRCSSCAQLKVWQNPGHREHMSLAHEGQIPTNLAQLKIMAKGNKYRVGKIPWNKGKKIPEMSGEARYNWKGANVGYSALHSWVRRNLGRPKNCLECGFESDNIRQFHWANVSREYKRDLSDWIRLCAKCHKAYDTGKLTLAQLGG